ANDPQRILAEHPLASGQHGLERDVERVTDMQAASGVGRRHDDRPRSLVRAIRPEQPPLLPMRVPAILDRAGFKSLGKFAHAEARLAMPRCSINPTSLAN